MAIRSGTVVRAATVLTPAGPVEEAEVVVGGGVVAEIRPAAGPLDHPVLAPGFIDLQLNGIGGVDVSDARDGEWEALDRAVLAQGVTTWCPTLVSAPPDRLARSLGRVAEAAARPAGSRPSIAGAHLEGPFLAVPGAHPPGFLRTPVDAGWLSGLGPLAVVTLSPEVPGALDAVERLAAAGVLVALGHSACTLEQAQAAADAGARLVTHLGNAMGPFRPRQPGLLGAALADERLAVSLIADGVHVHPAFLRIAFRAKGARRTVLVTDAVATGPGPPPHDPPRLDDGTLVGSVLSMDRALATTVAAGVSLADAVTAASTTPAALLRLDDRGAIAPGRRADLVALDHDLRVRGVWGAGREVSL